jgi:ATP-dependent Lhr-like helicase
MTRYREAKKRTQEKIARSLSQQASPWRGHWTLVRRASILGAPLTEEERAEKWARVLLERYGVVTRSVLEREENAPLDLLYPLWQRMEWRGQVRRGIFVADMPGVQYALPEAVEQLRATQNALGETAYVLNATDPANLFGGDGSAWKFARLPSTHVVLWRGQPVLIAQENGERLTTASNVNEDILRDAVKIYFERASAPRHAMVTEWNDTNVLGSEGEKFLQALEFYRMPKGMERWQRGT